MEFQAALGGKYVSSRYNFFAIRSILHFLFRNKSCSLQLYASFEIDIKYFCFKPVDYKFYI